MEEPEVARSQCQRAEDAYRKKMARSCPTLSIGWGTPTDARDGSVFTSLQEADCIRQGDCNSRFFFASGQVAAPWASEHPDFTVLPVEEAFLALRETAL